MKRGMQGTFEAISTVGEHAQAFVPAALPPAPPIVQTPELRDKLDQALLALGRLDFASIQLPDLPLFIYMYVRKEAVLSSMIEGTQSSLSDLLLYELEQDPGVPLDDVREVSNYAAAMEFGLAQLAAGFPLSLRLLREIHGVLLRQGRGEAQAPGEFRRSQNWIGGTRPANATFVPPPVPQMLACLHQLELFMHDQPVATPILVKAALIHHQFETIHPFHDGNGRLGRLLITLLLCAQNVLRAPLLYISLYFKQHRQRYYELLNRVRFKGIWEDWLAFFAEAVIASATQGAETAVQLYELSKTDQMRISGLRAPSSVLQVHQLLLTQPITTAGRIADKTQLSMPTVNKALEKLAQVGIVKELTLQKRNRLFSYATYMEILNRGTELPAQTTS